MKRRTPRVLPAGIVGTPVPIAPASTRNQLAPDDVWVRHYRTLAAEARRRGDRDAARKHLATIGEPLEDEQA